MSDRSWSERWLRAPWWARAIFAGVVYGLVQYLVQVVGEHRDPWVAALAVVPTAAIFGVLLGVFGARLSRRYLAARGDVPPGREAEVRRAVTKGPAPEDPAVRDAARRALEFRLDQLEGMRIWGSAVWVILTVMALWLAVSMSPWWLVTVPLFMGFLARQWWLIGQMRRRQVLLSPGDR